MNKNVMSCTCFVSCKLRLTCSNIALYSVEGAIEIRKTTNKIKLDINGKKYKYVTKQYVKKYTCK